MILLNWMMDRGGEAILVPGSNTGLGTDPDVPGYRIPGKHWLPPDLYGEIYDAAVWQLEIRYFGEDLADLGSSWTETWRAGTAKTVYIDDGARTEEIENAPGWQSISDALAGKRYLMPPPDDDDYWSLGLGSRLYWELHGNVGDVGSESRASIVVEARVPTITAGFYTAVPPASTFPSVWAPEALEPVWWVNAQISAEARIEDGILTTQTRIGAFRGQTVGSLRGPTDSEWSLTLSIASNHDTI